MKTNIKTIAIACGLVATTFISGCGNTATTQTTDNSITPNSVTSVFEKSPWYDYCPDLYVVLDLDSTASVTAKKETDIEDYLGMVEGIDIPAAKEAMFGYFRDAGFTEVEISNEYGFTMWTPDRKYCAVVYICVDNPYCDDYMLVRCAAAECFESDNAETEEN